MEVTGNVHIPFGTKGYYQVETKNSATGERVEEKCFNMNNTVTLDGKHYFFTRTSITGDGHGYSNSYWGAGNIGFGSGTTEIVETDTALGGTVITRESSEIRTSPVEITTSPRTIMTTVKRRAVYSPGTATGTWGQVGYLNGTTLLAGQVLRDNTGTPTTVTFLDIEEVTVTYIIEVTYTYGSGYMNTDTLLPAGTTTAVIDGVSRTLTFLGLPVWASGYSSYNALQDPDRGLNTFMYRQYYDDPRLIVKTANDENAPDADWVYQTGRVNQNNMNSRVTLEKGRRYKLSDSFYIPYTSIQDKYIKEFMMMGNNGNMSRINQYYRSAVGGMKVDPPIFKGAGYDLAITFHVIYEIV